LASQVSLTVLYVTGRDTLSAKNVIALRDLISGAAPIDFVFLNPGSFEVFFPGTEEGKAKARQLNSALRSLASRQNISPFGVGVQIGPCLVAQDARGRFTSPPIGETISRAMRAAIQEARSAL